MAMEWTSGEEILTPPNKKENPEGNKGKKGMYEVRPLLDEFSTLVDSFVDDENNLKIKEEIKERAKYLLENTSVANIIQVKNCLLMNSNKINSYSPKDLAKKQALALKQYLEELSIIE